MHKNTGEKWDESTQLESIELRLSRPLDSRRGDSILKRDINMLPVTRGEMQSPIERISIVHDDKVTGHVTGMHPKYPSNEGATMDKKRRASQMINYGIDVHRRSRWLNRRASQR